jgi:hypothetical protein
MTYTCRCTLINATLEKLVRVSLDMGAACLYNFGHALRARKSALAPTENDLGMRCWGSNSSPA